MQIGIITSSIYDDYATALIRELIEHSNKPVMVILAKRSIVATTKKYLKRTGLKGLILKLTDFRLEKAMVGISGTKVKSNTQIDSLLDLCKKEGIEVKKTVINTPSAVKCVKNKNLDILINSGGGICKKPIIEAPNTGILNAHMAILPEFRGMNVLEWSLFYNKRIGVTVHFIDRGIDTGDILLFQEIIINNDDTIESLRLKSKDVNIDLMVKCIDLLKSNKLERRRQIHEEGRQYFIMHHRLRNIIVARLKKINKPA